MAKKNQPVEQNTVLYKTMDEMSNREFLENIDKCAEQVYFDRLYAPIVNKQSVSGYISDARIGMLAKNAKMPIKGPQTQTEEPLNRKNKNKKHIVPLLVILLLTAVMIACAVVGYIGVEALDKYVGMYYGTRGSIAMTDPITTLVSYLTGEMTSVYYVVFYIIANEPIKLLPLYAIDAAIAIYCICMVCMLLKAVIALGGKKNGCGYYKRRKFGFMSIVAFLCAVVCLVGGLYVSGGTFSEIMTFAFDKSIPMGAGYALYAMIVVPIITFIMSACSYGCKRKKK